MFLSDQIASRFFIGDFMYLTLANQITLLRILLVFPFVICLLQTNHPDYGNGFRGGAIVIFLMMALSDALDGYLARVKKQVSALGAFLDPMADKLMITCASVILCVPQTAIEGFHLPLAVVVLIIGKDVLLLLGFSVTYFLTVQVHIHPVWVGKASTFLQIIMVFSILIGPEAAVWVHFWPLLTEIIWWSTGFCAVVATFVYIYRGIRYIEAFHNTQN
jgi:CDP-diacylglycerol--glycerol-3-phosphate 3-phosphatidyltransferase